MNTLSPRPPPLPRPLPEPEPPPAPMGREELGAGALLSAILKGPERVAATIEEGGVNGRIGWVYLIFAAACHALFGLAIGLFGGWGVSAMAAAKAPLIAICSLLLCFPSLYVFSAVGGAALSVGQAFALGSACLAMIGLILLGLAPVAWLFAVSTSGLGFVVILVLLIWALALIFAARFIGVLRLLPTMIRTGGISAWLLIFTVVSLQMATCMRPVLTHPGEADGWWTAEKKFFLAHFQSCFEKPATPAKK